MITNQETKVPSIIDANNVEIQEADNFEENEKIICFPQKHVS
jgi:hypothetical protein